MSKIGNHVVMLYEHPAFEMGYNAYYHGESQVLWINRAINLFGDTYYTAMESYAA